MTNNQGARWMVVDNDKEALDTLARLLTELTNAEVRAFHSAPDALDTFVMSPESYELVVIDFETPRMNGVDLRRNLHTVEPAPRCPITRTALSASI